VRRTLALAGALAGSALLAGCASQTTLLLPGEAGHPVGALVRLNKDGSDGAMLNEANEGLKGGNGVRRNVKVKPVYNELISGLPLPAKSFTLTFALGADLPEVTDANRRTIDYIRDEMALRPGAEVQVTGHTDKSGGPQINIKLSEDRAANFRKYLIQNGFSEDQVSAVGRSSLEPFDPGNPDDDAKNRRIEVIVR
jgi:outer membrane protein OmpA-like peptidoglycan-associated protein